MNAVCRAVTFISYHIPLMEDMGEMPQYSTIGFLMGCLLRNWMWNMGRMI